VLASCFFFLLRSFLALVFATPDFRTSTHLLFLTVLSSKALNLLSIFRILFPPTTEQKDRFADFGFQESPERPEGEDTHNCNVECIELQYNTLNIPRTQYSTHFYQAPEPKVSSARNEFPRSERASGQSIRKGCIGSQELQGEYHRTIGFFLL